MWRCTARRLLGYTPVNPDTSPMILYSNYHWHYNLPQGMERPHAVNRSLPAPFMSAHRNVNRYRGVWVEAGLPYSSSSPSPPPLLPLAYEEALHFVLCKLPQGRGGRTSTPVAEAVADYEQYSPQLLDLAARDGWLVRLLHHCALARDGEAAMRLWESQVAPRFPPSSRMGSADTKPMLPLVRSILFALSKADHPGWRPIFQRCLKAEWNYAPHFETAQWSFLLKSAGRQGDESGVRVLLEEMLDVKADLDRVEARSIVFALNAVKDPSIYNYVKAYLFHFGERKVNALRRTYSDLRGHGAGKLRLPLQPADNEAMYYHMCWHASIRSPRGFSPRQLYFDYKPTTVGVGAQHPDAKISDIVRDKIEKWKAEGLLPDDYVHEDQVYDKGAAFKNVARQEKWKKMPRIVKNPRFGYTGD